MSNLSKKPKILILATTASMIEQFNMHNIQLLQSLGAEVHVGTNFIKPGTITIDKSNTLIKKLNEKNVETHQIDFMRGIGTHKMNKIALNQVCNVIRNYNITGIHAHSPLGGIIGRRAAHKTHTKIIYTAHGFQFFKGGPVKDWLIFFPIEWFYSRWTDVLITINKQDYGITKRLRSRRNYYIPGVGIDFPSDREVLKGYSKRDIIRKKFNLKERDFLIISVGELNENKNHAIVIEAIKRINDPTIKYFIAGLGPERNKLQKMIDELNLGNQVKLLGFINDLNDLYYAADLNVFPSKREGLGLGGLDGVARGLYIIGNKKTGMKDYITNRKIGILIDNIMDVNEIVQAIESIIPSRPQIKDRDSIYKFSHENVDRLMSKIYEKEFF